MSFELIATAFFRREAKRLAKKHRSLKDDLAELAESLAATPDSGTPLDNQCFKVRLAVRSKGKGKSGGARVITRVMSDERRVYLLAIYDKSEIENISDQELKRIIAELEAGE